MPEQIWRLVSVLFTALAFGLGFREHKNAGELLLFAGALAVAVVIANWYQTRSLRFGERLYDAGLPVLFLFGYFGTLAAVSAPSMKVVVAALGAGIFYLFELYLPSTHPRAVGEVTVLTTGFLFQVTLWAGNFFFLLPWWALMCAVFTFSSGLFFLMFVYRDLYRKNALFWALICALVQVEIAWAVFFWPVHFLTAAVTNFACFYILFIVSSMHFEGRLHKKGVYFQIILILIVLLMSLLSSPWSPLQ